MPDCSGALEEAALGVSLFEIEDEERRRAVAWQASTFFAEAPDQGCRRLAQLAARSWPRDERTSRSTTVPAQDWVARLAMRLPPVQVGRFFVHGAQATAGELPPGAVPIEVEAGLAFGSGEHATTQACLEAIDASPAGAAVRRVLDLGCGSGILAIAAAQRWPTARVIAADNDPVAGPHRARERPAQNGLAARAAVALSDGFRTPDPPHGALDLILANILADLLIDLAPALARRLAPGGFAVLSGLLDRQAEAVTRA